jgi:hypothetical protein
MTAIIAKRLAATFVSAAVPSILAGSLLVDVAVWKAAVMAGAVATLNVVQSLAVAYKDGKLTAAEVESAFNR